MSSFHLEDGTELEKPATRFVHRYSSYGARDSGKIEASIIERQFGDFIFLSGSINDPEKWDWVLGDYLAAIVHHRISEGWKLTNMDADSATLVKA